MSQGEVDDPGKLPSLDVEVPRRSNLLVGHVQVTVLRSLLLFAVGVFLAYNTVFALRRGNFNARGGASITRRNNPYSFWFGIAVSSFASLFLLVRAIQIVLQDAMINYYPLFIALAGFVVAALLSQRALSLMQADAKVALMNASAPTRLITILVAAVFTGLIIWRPAIAWAFLGIAYTCLAVRSIFRVQHLNLPASNSRLLHAANLTACVGMVICSCIFELRALQ